MSDLHTPLQLWLLTLGPSLGFPEVERDMSRALQAWQGESTVWLLPELNEPRRWWPSGKPVWKRTLAIPAEHFDRVDVFHIGANGYVWGPGAHVRFPGGRVDGLLMSWLHAWDLPAAYEKRLRDDTEIPLGGMGAFLAELEQAILANRGGHSPYWLVPRTLTIDAPRITDGAEVSTEDVEYTTVEVQPCLTLPDLAWSERRLPMTISPEAELTQWYGPLDCAETDRGLPVVFHKERDRYICSLRLQPQWLAPLAPLLSAVGGWDDLFEQGKMQDIIQHQRDKPEDALQKATVAARRYLSPGHTTQLFQWVLPTVLEQCEARLLLQLEGRARLAARDMDTVAQSAEWRTVMTQQIPIQRAWGAAGLFWSLLLDKLESYQSLQTCERCGQLFKGRQKKRFCGPNDNQQCYRANGAARQRKSRAHRSSEK